MALLDSTDFTGGTVSHDTSARTYTITGGVRVINAALTAPTGGWPGYRIICRNSGGLRFAAGATGTMGAGVAPVVIIEESNGATYGGGDNYNSGGGTGSSARFAGGTTNTMVFDNVRWEIDSGGGRKDFDIGRGDSNYNGPAITFKGVEVIVSGSNTCFNHQASKNWKCEPSDYRPFGLRVTNYTNNAAWEFSSPITTAPTGAMVFSDTDPSNTTNAHVAVQPGAIPVDGVFSITGLSCRSIAVVAGNNNPANLSQRTLRLIDPDGDIPVLSWSNQYICNKEIVRTQPFNFSLAGDASGTLYADAQDTDGRDATATISSAGVANPQLLTQVADDGDNDWTAVNNFRFHAVGWGFRKFYSTDTNVAVATAPATLNYSLTVDAFPDGNAITDYTSTDGANTASEIYRIIKKHELANPTHRTLDASLATIDSSGNIDIDSTVGLNVSTSQTPLSSWASASSTLTVKVQTGITADKGINSLNFGNRSIPALQIANFAMPTTTSLGTSSLLTIEAHANEVAGVFKNDGTKLGHKAFASDGSYSLLITAANSLANTRIGLARAGYEGRGKTVNLSSGGVHSIDFDQLLQVPGPDGVTALYDSSANSANLVEGVIQQEAGNPNANPAVVGVPPVPANHKAKKPGDCVLKIGEGNASPADVFKAYHDAVAANDGEGCRVPAFGRRYLYAVDLTGQPGNLFLGPDCILSRDDDNSAGAFFLGYPFGGIGGEVVDGPSNEFISYTISVGSCNLDLINKNIAGVNTAVAAVKADTETIQEQNEHQITSYPLTLHEPLSPLCIITGLEGQEIIRDTEETQWPLTASGIAGNGDPDAHGVVEFDGNNSHLDYSLNRAAAGETPDLYTTEIIVLCQVYPTSFPSAGQRPFGNIGALTLSVNNSTGNTAALHLGAGAGATTTTNRLNLNQWNDLVFVFTRNANRPNNPRIRVSINGSAQETGNLGADSTLGNNIFGPIASNTENFRIGGHGTGSQTSGFQGKARAIFVHPDNEVYGTDGWDIPAGVYWNTSNQLWQGAQLMDRVEGIAVDKIERTIDSIEAKTYTSDEIGIFPWRALTSNLTGATGSIGKKLAELNNPETKGDIATAVRDVSNSSPAANSLGAAVNAIPTTEPLSDAGDLVDKIWDEPLSGHSTAGTAGKKLTDIPTTTYTIPTPPSVNQIWNAELSNYTTAGTAGKKLSETSTHGAPADSPTAEDIWNHPIPNSPTAGTAVAKLKSLSNGPAAGDIVEEFLNRELESGVSFLEFYRAIGAAFGGRATPTGMVVDYKQIGGGDKSRLQITMGEGDGERTAAVIPTEIG